MAKDWFTSDLHLGHASIIKYCKRPFKDVYQMNDILIRNWNARVKPEDTVYFLGDFCFKNTSGGKEGEGLVIPAKYYLEQLNGHIVIIKGNHDKNNGVRSKLKSGILQFKKRQILIQHRPPMKRKDIPLGIGLVLCGHVHEKWKHKIVGNIPVINMSVDVWNFMPATYSEILKYLNGTIKRKQEKI